MDKQVSKSELLVCCYSLVGSELAPGSIGPWIKSHNKLKKNLKDTVPIIFFIFNHFPSIIIYWFMSLFIYLQKKILFLLICSEALFFLLFFFNYFFCYYSIRWRFLWSPVQYTSMWQKANKKWHAKVNRNTFFLSYTQILLE